MLLANIKASDQVILDLENMACLLIEQRLEKFCVAGHVVLQYSRTSTTIGLALRETRTFGTGVVALHFMAGAAVT